MTMATAPKNTADENVTAEETEGTEVLFSKSDIAEMMGMSTQALANRAKREEGFPKPTYSNRGGTMVLYSAKDVEAIVEFMTREDRERTARLAAALKGVKK
jgi:hypothetical protein